MKLTFRVADGSFSSPQGEGAAIARGHLRSGGALVLEDGETLILPVSPPVIG